MLMNKYKIFGGVAFFQQSLPATHIYHTSFGPVILLESMDYGAREVRRKAQRFHVVNDLLQMRRIYVEFEQLPN